MSKPLDKQQNTKEEELKTQEPETSVSDVEAWKNKYLRALADYQNLEKRTAQRHGDNVRMAARSLIVKLLPIVDIFYKVQESINDQGMTLAMKQLEEVLESEQVKKLDTVGKPFDPQTMECIEVIEGKEDNVVTEETRVGYLLHDQVIRPTQVKVGKKKTEQQDKTSDTKGKQTKEEQELL